jgi:hypothetical protein
VGKKVVPSDVEVVQLVSVPFGEPLVLLSLLFLSIVVVVVAVAVLLLFVPLLFGLLVFVLLLLLGSCVHVVVVVIVGSVDGTGGTVEGATASSSVNATALKYGGGHAASTRASPSPTVSLPLLARVEEGVAVVVPFAGAAVVAFDAHSMPHVSSATAALTAARTSVDPVSATSYTLEAVSGVVTRL